MQGWEAAIAKEAATMLKVDMCYGDGGRIWSAGLRQRPSRLVELQTPPRLPGGTVEAVRAAAVRVFKVCVLQVGAAGEV